jgi:hypothetical protein
MNLVPPGQQRLLRLTEDGKIFCNTLDWITPTRLAYSDEIYFSCIKPVLSKSKDFIKYDFKIQSTPFS